MSNSLPSPGVPLTPDARRRIADACTRFDQAYSAGLSPRIEAHIPPDWPPEERRDLLKGLLEIEFYYRQRAGATMDLNEYLRRFPGQSDVVRAVAQGQTTFVPTQRGIGARPGAAAETAVDPDRTGPAEPPAPSPGVTKPQYPAVPSYEILDELGRGGMGVVYRARQTALNRVVALKMILSGDRAAPEELARFRREAVTVARLGHPNIVQVHEVGEHDGRPFFSLEFVDGGTLAAKLRAGLPNPKDAAALVEKLARAMHAVHQANVVHRDLKPANVLLTADGTPKITDFGLAKKLDDESGRTHSGAIMGTPSYMAPEQASGAAARATPLADVYALGAILYECLTGRPPFKAASVAQTLRQVVEDEPAAPRALNPAVPRDLETICLKCLRKEPAQRYATANDLAEDLRRLLALDPILARPVGRAERAAKWARRNRALTAALGVFALGAMISTALVVWASYRGTALEESNQKLGESENKRQETESKLGQSQTKLGESETEVEKKRYEVNKKTVQKWLEPQGLQAGSDVPLHDREVEALWELAGTPEEPLRLLFVKEAIREPGTTEQLKNRRAFALHAAVALDKGRRRDVERMLVDRLSAPETPPEQKVHLAMLVATLGDATPESARLAGATLAQALGKDTNTLTLKALAEGLAALAPAWMRRGRRRRPPPSLRPSPRRRTPSR